MFKEERKVQIQNILTDTTSATVEHLAEVMRVSPSTIRRDLVEMEDSGLVTRTHGGAILSQTSQQDYNFNEKRATNYELKNAIGRRAAALVDEGDIIALNSSTITSLMAEHLDVKHLTVVTNSITIINTIVAKHPAYQLVILGGLYMGNAQTIEGSTTTEQIMQMQFDKAFFGVNGIDPQAGLTTAGELETKSKKAMISQSTQAYCLAEHQKFEKNALFRVAPVEKVDGIVTDWAADRATLAAYENLTKIYVAEAIDP